MIEIDHWSLDRLLPYAQNARTHSDILNDNLGEGFARFLYDSCVNILTVTKGGIYVCM